MGRRSEHSRDELQGLAIQAVIDIVSDGGPAALTVRALAARMGYTPGTLYQLFDGFDGLVLVVNGHTLDNLGSAISQPPCGAGITPLQVLVVRLAGFVRDHENLWRLFIEHRISPGGTLPEWYCQKLETPQRIIADAFRAELQSTSDEDCRQAALSLWAAFYGLSALGLSGQLPLADTDKLDQQLESIVQALRRSLNKKKLGLF